ncbi:MAG: twin-arginine translocase TatA/TatE family subunit [Anaerovibrio sp.]|uniref:twin-arginine translocase TatA/TatE family subunit n=1 Tax=Anaerovibrio sp. TaxID=1872532 RepID=UPI0025CE2F0A|nr:twin-arginine translocase TatA/TatE family subunit [Anaerovibrio sp.]MCR5176919.1 twin-arginine translocase TatA/TatE family subunit [Anaerovibrio sp.]
MFGIGVPELIIILIIGLIVFGPGKLPEIGRGLGKTIREFRKVSSGIMEEEPVPEKKELAQSATVSDASGKTEAVSDGKEDKIS